MLVIIVLTNRIRIDENRLFYIRKHQDDFRSDSLQGLTDSIDEGNSDGASVGKKVFYLLAILGVNAIL
jgi:hypothetical protein